MRMIKRFGIPSVPCGEFSIELPSTHKVLSVGLDQGSRIAYVWILVDPDAPKSTRTFRVIRTGDPVENLADWNFVGTYDVDCGETSRHLFERVHRPDLPRL